MAAASNGSLGRLCRPASSRIVNHGGHSHTSVARITAKALQRCTIQGWPSKPSPSRTTLTIPNWSLNIQRSMMAAITGATMSGRSSMKRSCSLNLMPACCPILPPLRLPWIVYNIAHNTMPRQSSSASVKRALARAPGRRPSGTSVGAISARVEEDIVLGRLQPREHLVEQDLADRFGTHRAAVRQALFDLDKKGLIERVPNRGALVRDLSPDDVQQIYAVREELASMPPP